MSLNSKLPKKISLKPKRHHGFQAVLFLLGCLLPPLAVAARFGIGTDFFINTFLCICGYFPCHFHNFYIQNIRNNTNRARTPKWAIKAGLVDNSDAERKAKRSQWAKRFDERNNQSTHIGASLEEGEEGDNYVPVSDAEVAAAERRRTEGLWTNQDEEFYNDDEDRARNQQSWHYPANFEGAVGDGRSFKRQTSNVGNGANGDRWERSRARRDSGSSGGDYPPSAATDENVPEWGKDYGSKRRSSKNKKAAPAGGPGKGGWAAQGGYVADVAQEDRWANGSSRAQSRQDAQPPRQNSGRSGDIFNHEF